jgi:hypothetical protein
MTRPELAETCRNRACACPPASRAHGLEGACSAYCANVERHDPATEAACSCGHGACRRAQQVAPARPEPSVSVGPIPGRDPKG